MYGQSVKSVLDKRKLVTASPETSVSEAAKLMARRKVSAVMVVEERRLVGIFTERDAVFRVVARDLDPHATRRAEVMTRDPKTVDPQTSFGYALLMMHENGFRHVPVVENHELIGVVSARDALDPDLEEFIVEAERRKQVMRERN